MCRPQGTRSRSRQLALFRVVKCGGSQVEGWQLTHAFLVWQAMDFARERLTASGGKTECGLVLRGT
jgi:hypothetical protein